MEGGAPSPPFAHSIQMKKLLAIAAALVVSLSAFCDEIPASITGRTVTEQTWRALYDNLCREVAGWRTPTHTPEFLDSFWKPLFALKPQYYSVGDEYLGEAEICQGTWFEAYQGKTVAKLVAIGIANRKRYAASPLTVEEAATTCMRAHFVSGCKKYLAIIMIEDEEIARVPGLTPEQTAKLTQDDLAIIIDDRLPCFIVTESPVSAKPEATKQSRHRELLWAFMEAYNKALYEKLKPMNPPAPEALQPSS